MKNHFRYLSVIAAGVSIFAGTAVFAESFAVQVKSTKLRSEPKVLGKSVADLSYGDPVTSTEEVNGWYKVKTASGASGYVHQSAVGSADSIQSSKGSRGRANVGVDAGDVALAGKGFNPEVENGLKAANPSLNFAAVDRMETSNVSSTELRGFIVAGKLKS